MNNKITDKLIKAFEFGVNYGLLLAEQERDGEHMGDAVLCMAPSAKYGVPSAPMLTRQPHSNEWRQKMKDSMAEFVALYAECTNGGYENA